MIPFHSLITIGRSHWGYHPPLPYSPVAEEEEARDKPDSHRPALQHSALDKEFDLNPVMVLGEVVARAALDRVGIGSVFGEARAEYVDKVRATRAAADRIAVDLVVVAVADGVFHPWGSRGRVSTRLVSHPAGDGAGMLAVWHLWDWHMRMTKALVGCHT